MSRNPLYRFDINGTDVSPIWADNARLEWSHDPNDVFFRSKLAGNFTLRGKDYDFIQGQSIETPFIFTVWMLNEATNQYEGYHVAKFFKTQCRFDRENKTIQIDSTPQDQYDGIMKIYENEYNLAEMGVESVPCTVTVRTVLQLFAIVNGAPDTRLTNFLSGMYWEEEVVADDINDNTLVSKYRFYRALQQVRMGVSTAAGSVTPNPDIRGNYTIDQETISAGQYTREDNLYQITYRRQASTIGGNLLYQFFYSIRNVSTNVYVIRDRLYAISYSATYWPQLNRLTWGDNNMYVVQLARADTTVYARALTQADQISGTATYARPGDDITNYNRHYTRVIGVNPGSAGTVTISLATQTAPTKWGRSETGAYFVQPYSLGYPDAIPIGISQWGEFSIWFFYLQALYTQFLNFGDVTHIIKDNYTIGGCIRAILRQENIDVEHFEDEAHSNFLYGLNELWYDRFRMLITPKSNITRGPYDKAAQKAPTSLAQLFEMLRKVYKCYWWIDDGQLRIENIRYFNNGGAYTGNPVVQIDLTELPEPRLARSWAKGVNQWEFNREELPDRYEFKWMDDVPVYFSGNAIEVVSSYVEDGRKEEIAISNFTSDVDYMLVMGENVSSDGFALLCPQITTFRQIDAKKLLYVNSAGREAASFDRQFIKYQYTGNGPVFLTATCFDNAPGVVYLNSSNQVLGTDIPAGTQTNVFKFMSTPPSGTTIIAVNGSMEFTPEAIGEYKLPIKEIGPGVAPAVLQNYIASMMYIQQYFYRDDVSGRLLRINGDVVNAVSVIKSKRQEVTIPKTILNTIGLIKTGIGNGTIENISVNLADQVQTVTLKYQTDANDTE